MCPARWTELRHAPGATASSRTRAGWRHNDETSRTGGKDLECGDLSPLFRFGDLSPKQGRVQRPARVGRLPAFDGDKAPAESADKSTHSKVATLPRWEKCGLELRSMWVAKLLVPAFQELGMDAGHVAHGRIGWELGHRFLNVLAAFQDVAGGFVVQPEVKVGVEQLPIAFGGLGVAGFGGLEDIFRPGFAGEEGVDLGHRHAGIAGDGDEGSPGVIQAGKTRGTEEMPDRVFDVVGVDRLVKFELLLAVGKTLRVIADDAALPEMRRRRLFEPDGGIEVCNGIVEFAKPEAAPSAVLVEDRSSGIEGEDSVEVREGLGVLMGFVVVTAPERKSVAMFGVREEDLCDHRDGFGAVAFFPGFLGLLEQLLRAGDFGGAQREQGRVGEEREQKQRRNGAWAHEGTTAERTNAVNVGVAGRNHE